MSPRAHAAKEGPPPEEGPPARSKLPQLCHWRGHWRCGGLTPAAGALKNPRLCVSLRLSSLASHHDSVPSSPKAPSDGRPAKSQTASTSSTARSTPSMIGTCQSNYNTQGPALGGRWIEASGMPTPPFTAHLQCVAEQLACNAARWQSSSRLGPALTHPLMRNPMDRWTEPLHAGQTKGPAFSISAMRPVPPLW